MSSKKKDKNLGLGIAFLLFFLVLIFASISLKVFFLFTDAKFDGSHRFNVFFSSEGKESIVSFCPECSSMTILKINKDSKTQNIAKEFLIPVDGKLSGDGLDAYGDMSANLLRSLFSFGKIKSDLNTIDLIRLVIFTKSISESAILEKNISFREGNLTLNSILSSIFSDPTIVSEKTKIEIINGTGISGLGNRLAGLISNMGGVVILVKNSESLQEKSTIKYLNKKNYTINRLGKLLNVKMEKGGEGSIADAVILIGKDSLEKETF